MSKGTTGRLAGRHILITGAASGIGKATAALFAAQGAKLALVDRNAEALDRVAGPLGATALACDVGDEQQVGRTVEAAEAAMGALDGVINAAGISRRGTIEETTTADWTATMQVNLFGPFFLCRAAIPALRRAGRASIANVASIGALRPARGVGAYCASKAGILMLTKCLAFELGPDIRVNAVCPGTIETAMTEGLLRDPATAERLTKGNALGRLGAPEEIAEALLYLTSSESSYTNGATLVVDGGYIWH